MKEVSELLRVPVATVYAWRHKGEGPPGIKVGRHIRFRRRDVESWLDDQTCARHATRR
ncbi:MAG TPA: helix-turn-helix domain-containing protein [Candidatus Methylomirabilis sp.]|nr:helix-turn-helix domain-containing protein [Candidatus Methylomirabilis sp.]